MCGGGGIPTYYDEHHNLQGVEAVIDKDLCSALLAENLDADLFIIATDVSATFVDWGKPNQKAISVASPEAISELGFASGSMGPKVQAAINFAKQTGKDAVIGSLSDIVDIVKGKAGTRITKKAGRHILLCLNNKGTLGSHSQGKKCGWFNQCFTNRTLNVKHKELAMDASKRRKRLISHQRLLFYLQY